MREELLPCNLETRIEANSIPANRAALKLFDILEDLARDETATPKTSEIADLIKSEYFRLNDEDLKLLSARFDAQYSELLRERDQPFNGSQEQRLKSRYGIGGWNADALENAFAYVGSKQRIREWLDRAQTLIRELPAAEATRELLNIEGGEQGRDPDVADQLENAETAKVEERRRKKTATIARHSPGGHHLGGADYAGIC